MSPGTNGKSPRELQYERFREFARKLGSGSLENELEECLARLVPRKACWPGVTGRDQEDQANARHGGSELPPLAARQHSR